MGLIANCLARVRKFCDEPVTAKKYSDADIIEYLQTSYRTVIQDLNASSSCPLVVRLDISVVANQSDYILPPNVGEIIRLAKWNTTTDLMSWEIKPDSRYNPSGPGFTIEGGVLKLSPVWSSTDTLRLEYVPTGDCLLHEGNTTTFTTTTFTLAASPTTGTRDIRYNGYVGCVLRILGGVSDSRVEQTRFISSQSYSDVKVLTVPSAFAPALSGTEYYEIVPQGFEGLEMLVCLDAARMILSIEADSKRLKHITDRYGELKRSLRLQQANMENRMGQRFLRDPEVYL